MNKILPDEKPLRILICPLNWGLGHATRCRPIIEELVGRGHEVHLAGDGLSFLILRKNYPALAMHDLATLKIEYGLKFWATLVKQLPAILKWYYSDKKRILRLHKRFHFELIISDSRPGCRIDEIPSVFLISQPSPLIPFPGIDRLVHSLLGWLYRQFDVIWIPDQSGETTLSGKLIDLPESIKARRIGFLSKLERDESSIHPFIPFRILAVVSGPEPMRTAFEQDLRHALNGLDHLIVGGRPDHLINNPNYVSYLEPMALTKEITKAEYIICRAGYSTLMDLASFQKKLIMVPTPGQSEQVYLAMRIQAGKQGVIWDIKHISWQAIQGVSDHLDPFYLKNDKTLLPKAIEDIENYCKKKINLHA